MEARAAIAGIALLSAVAQPTLAASGGYCQFTMRTVVPKLARGQGKAPTKAASLDIKGQAWRSGENVRVEMDMGERGRRVILFNPSVMYTLAPDKKVAVKKTVTPQDRAQALDGFPIMFLTPVDPPKRWKGAKRVGSGRMSGVACSIWRADLPGRVPQNLSLWLPAAQRSAAPLKVEVSAQIPGLSNGQLTREGGTIKFIMIVTKARPGVAVAKSMFEVPPGYAVRSASTASRN